jgi:hypothetical protein
MYFCLLSASEPFAVNRSSLLNDLVQTSKPNNQQLSDKENLQIVDGDEPPSKYVHIACMENEVEIQMGSSELKREEVVGG